MTDYVVIEGVRRAGPPALAIGLALFAMFLVGYLAGALATIGAVEKVERQRTWYEPETPAERAQE